MIEDKHVTCLRELSEAFKGVPTETEFELQPFTAVEGNLEYPAVLDGVMVDAAGRLWRQDRLRHKLVMFFDPRAK